MDNVISDAKLLSLFIQLFAIAFSIIYVFFSVIYLRQIGFRSNALKIDSKGLLTASAIAQLALSTFLLVCSILFL